MTTDRGFFERNQPAWSDVGYGLLGPIGGRAAKYLAGGYGGASAPTEDPAAAPTEPALPTGIEDVPLEGEGGRTAPDLSKLLEDGRLDMDEVLQLVIQAQLEAQPVPDDYEYPEDYSADAATWAQGITEVLGLQQKARESKAGLIRIDDNTVIPESLLASLSPGERAQVDYIRQLNDAKLDNEYATIVNKYQVEQYDRALDRTKLEDDRRQREFDNQRRIAADAMDADRFDLEQAVANVNRSLQGLAEGRSRAGQIEEDRMAAAAYGTTGGKTDFSAADFGGLTSAMAQRAGLNPQASLFRFPGSYTVDPEATLARQDARLGVSGQIPGLPQGGTSARSLFPGAVPSSGALPDLPSLMPPPALPRRPGAAASNVGGAAATPEAPGAPAPAGSLFQWGAEDLDTPRGADPYAGVATTSANDNLLSTLLRMWR